MWNLTISKRCYCYIATCVILILWTRQIALTRMETLCNCNGIVKVTRAQTACQQAVQWFNWNKKFLWGWSTSNLQAQVNKTHMIFQTINITVNKYHTKRNNRNYCTILYINTYFRSIFASSSAVAKRPCDASCLSVFFFFSYACH